MANAYAISDLVICRSGALTCSEITYCGKPSILLPLKNSAGDHQKRNAESLSKNGAAIIAEESSLANEDFIELIDDLIKLPPLIRALTIDSFSFTSTYYELKFPM